MMKRTMSWLVAGASCLLMACASAATTEISGVKLESPIELAGTKLVLNGAGIRYRTVIPVYVAGLYLVKKANSPDAVQAVEGPKRISVTMLRNINSSELGKIFIRGVENNTPKKDMFRLMPALTGMSQLFTDHKNLEKGDTFSVDWIPNTGTVFLVNGKIVGGPFKEPEFFAAMLRIWLGPSPADWKLKDALLGLPLG